LAVFGHGHSAEGLELAFTPRRNAAIRKLPFPPVDIQIKSKYDKVSISRKAGNLLSWQRTTKTADAGLIAGYRVYRKKPDESPDQFRRLGFVAAFYAFFDAEILGTEPYEYVVATLGKDGVEGSCSEVVRIL